MPDETEPKMVAVPGPLPPPPDRVNAPGPRPPVQRRPRRDGGAADEVGPGKPVERRIREKIDTAIGSNRCPTPVERRGAVPTISDDGKRAPSNKVEIRPKPGVEAAPVVGPDKPTAVERRQREGENREPGKPGEPVERKGAEDRKTEPGKPPAAIERRERGPEAAKE